MNTDTKVTTRSISGFTAICFLVSGLALSGCGPTNKAQTGAGMGALGGGLFWAFLGPSKDRTRNALIGAVVGGALGYMVGANMDQNDQARLNDSFETSPSRQTTKWVNPDNNNAFAVTPFEARVVDGRHCRDAEIESVIDGKIETIVRTACRRDDGRWEIQEG